MNTTHADFFQFHTDNKHAVGIRHHERTRYVQIVVKRMDIHSATAKTVFSKAFPVPVFIGLLVLLSPLLLAIGILLFIKSLFSFFGKQDHFPTYEEADRFYKQGKGYLANLSQAEKAKLLAKKKS